MGKGKTTEIEVWEGVTFTLERTEPTTYLNSRYDVYYNGALVAEVYGGERSTDKMAGAYIKWSTKPRKKWGFTMAGKETTIKKCFLPTRKAALEWIADTLDKTE